MYWGLLTGTNDADRRKMVTSMWPEKPSPQPSPIIRKGEGEEFAALVFGRDFERLGVSSSSASQDSDFRNRGDSEKNTSEFLSLEFANLWPTAVFSSFATFSMTRRLGKAE